MGLHQQLITLPLPAPLQVIIPIKLNRSIQGGQKEREDLTAKRP